MRKSLQFLVVGSLFMSVTLLSVTPKAQRSWWAFFPNKYGMAGKLTWRWNDPPPAGERLPAISVAGENGGPAFYLGRDQKGSYFSQNGKIYYWEGEHLTTVAKLPDNLVVKINLDLDIDHPFKEVRPGLLMADINYKYRMRGGDPWMPWPAGRSGNVSWAYNAGGTPMNPSFPTIWIQGDQRGSYHGYDQYGSYLSDRSGKLFRWDGKTLTDADAIPNDLKWSRDLYVRTGNAQPYFANKFGPPNQKNKPAFSKADPFLPMRGNSDVNGRWGVARKIGWYYPVQGMTTVPKVTVFGTDGGEAIYQGYDEQGSYLTVQGKPMLWDGDNVFPTDHIPPPADLYNVSPTVASNDPAARPASTSSTASSSATVPAPVSPNQLPGTGNGDPFFPKGGPGNNFISWEYEGANNFPKIYMGFRGKMLDITAEYHGFDERGSYFTYDDKLTGSYPLLWDGKGNIIPVEKIPPHLHNPH